MVGDGRGGTPSRPRGSEIGLKSRRGSRSPCPSTSPTRPRSVPRRGTGNIKGEGLVNLRPRKNLLSVFSRSHVPHSSPLLAMSRQQKGLTSRLASRLTGWGPSSSVRPTAIRRVFLARLPGPYERPHPAPAIKPARRLVPLHPGGEPATQPGREFLGLLSRSRS